MLIASCRAKAERRTEALLDAGIQQEVLLHGHRAEQHILLRADAQRLPRRGHVVPHAVAHDLAVARGRVHHAYAWHMIVVTAVT